MNSTDLRSDESSFRRSSLDLKGHQISVTWVEGVCSSAFCLTAGNEEQEFVKTINVCLQVSSWSVEELRLRLASLDPQMEQEIEEIRRRYQTKRRPIMDAIEAKKRRQQNF